MGGFLLPDFCCCALAKIFAALLVDMVCVLAGLGENIEVGLTFFFNGIHYFDSVRPPRNIRVCKKFFV